MEIVNINNVNYQLALNTVMSVLFISIAVPLTGEYFQFSCSSGNCIDQQLRCDGNIDCPFDGSDEQGCRECRTSLSLHETNLLCSMSCFSFRGASFHICRCPYRIFAIMIMSNTQYFLIKMNIKISLLISV